MNNNFEYGPGNLYDLRAGNCTSVPDGGIVFHDEIVIGEIPLDVGNDNLLTIDGLNRVHQLPISSLPTGNPFDQDLNTTSSPEFQDVTLSNILQDDTQTRLLVLDSTTDLVEYRDVSTLPGGNVFDQNLNTTDNVTFGNIAAIPVIPSSLSLVSNGALLTGYEVLQELPNFQLNNYLTGSGPEIVWGGYRDSLGFLRMGNNSRGFCMSSNADGMRFYTLGGNVPGGLATIELQTLYRYQEFQRIHQPLRLVGLNSSTSLPEEICTKERVSGEIIKMKREDVYGQDLTQNSDVLFHELTAQGVVKLNVTAVGSGNTRYLTLNASDEIEEQILPSGGDVVGPVSSIDNTIPRYDGTTGKIIQNSGVSIDDNNNIITSGTINANTVLYEPEFDPAISHVIVKLNNPPPAGDEFKKCERTQLYGQDLSTGSNVVHNNIFADGLIQTDQILENSLNNGVDVTSWNIKTQKIQSDALVSETDPLIISMKHFGDANAVLEMNARAHDNNGIMMDMRHSLGTSAYLSSSINGNVFLHKNGASLDVKIQNGISPGLLVDPNTMNTVASFEKTSINLNETCNLNGGVIMSNLTNDPETLDTYFLTKNKSTNEVYQRDFQPAYGTINGSGNILETIIATQDVYVPLTGFIGSSDPLRNITIPALGDQLQVTNSGLYEINYNISIEPAALAATKLWETSTFINGVQTISSSVMCCQTTDAQELTEISNAFMFNLVAGDVIDLRIRNRTNTVNVIMRCATMTIKRLIN